MEASATASRLKMYTSVKSVDTRAKVPTKLRITRQRNTKRMSTHVMNVVTKVKAPRKSETTRQENTARKCHRYQKRYASTGGEVTA